MAKVISIVNGFITNSSSVVHGFDPAILKAPAVQAVLKAYGVEQGFIGEDLGSRSGCGSVLVDAAQVAKASGELMADEYTRISGQLDASLVWVMYGDEYESLAREVCRAMEEVAKENPALDKGSFEVH